MVSEVGKILITRDVYDKKNIYIAFFCFSQMYSGNEYHNLSGKGGLGNSIKGQTPKYFIVNIRLKKSVYYLDNSA